MLFLGLASNYSARDVLRHSFCIGSKKDYLALESTLAARYHSTPEKTTLIYSGRSAITLALESFKSTGRLRPGDLVGVNAFTCFAVIQAVTSAGLIPYYLDLAPHSPNFSLKTLRSALKSEEKLRCVIVQNSFGEAVDDKKLLSLKQKFGFYLIEDLAHCAGCFYPSGAEIGTIGDATCLSFGKGKAIDTITGGACILRSSAPAQSVMRVKTPELPLAFPTSFNKSRLVRRAKNGDVPRASWYPLFGAIARGFAHLHLEKFWLALLLKLHFIQRSADTALDLSRTITNWQAKLALRQLSRLPTRPKSHTNHLLREYYLVSDRSRCLAELRTHGFRLEEFWYELPVSPSRYYSRANFPEEKCKNAIFFASHVINLPTWYNDKKHRRELATARNIIKKYELT